MNKRRIILVVLVFVLVIIIAFLIRYLFNKKEIVQAHFENNIIDLNPISKVFLEDLGLENFTCTGMTFDNENQSILIADYGYINKNDSHKPIIIELNKELSRVKKIVELPNINSDEFVLQGISYNDSKNTIILATGEFIYEINKKGEILKQFDTRKNTKYLANGVAYDSENDEFFVLFYSKLLLKYDMEGSVKDKIKINYLGQDHLYYNQNNEKLYISMGVDYYSDDNFVLEFDVNSHQEERLFRIRESYSVEGIIIIDNILYVVNDGYYHNAKINKSYISIYDLTDYL